MSFRDLPANLRWYIVAHGLAILPLSVVLVVYAAPLERPWLATVVFLASVFFSTWKAELPVFQGRITPAFAVVCLALMLEGVPLAVLCAAVGAVVGSFVRPAQRLTHLRLLRPAAYTVVFNAANAALACGAGGLVYLATERVVSSSAWRDVVGLGLFTTVYFLVNSLGVSRAIAWQRGLAWLAVWREHFLWSGLGFFASASMAAGIRLAFEAMGPRALLLLPLLLLVFYWYQLHQDRLRLSEENARQAREHVEELQRLNEAVLSTLANAIDAKDPYTCSHINRVQIYALALAEAAGVEGPELLAVRTGALVHDIGKLAIPDHILGKPGKLTPEEYARIQTHVQVGAEILSPVPFDFPVIDVVLTHHERWDGLGYPRGLKGDEIPIGGRIISIVDVFDALTSNRPYRRALSHEEALQVLRDGAGKQFDPELVRRFEESLPEARREIARVEAEQQALAAERGADESQHALAQISAASAEMAAVLELSGPLAGARSLETVADLVVRGTLSLLPADTVVLYLKDPVEPHLVAAAAEGKYREKLLGMTVGDGEGVAGAVARDARPRVNVSAAPDVARRFGPDEVQELSAAAAVTLGPPERPLGVLAVYTVAYHVLSEHHLRVLRIISEQAAAAISRLSVRQEPEEESRDEAETSSTFAAR